MTIYEFEFYHDAAGIVREAPEYYAKILVSRLTWYNINYL